MPAPDRNLISAQPEQPEQAASAASRRAELDTKESVTWGKDREATKIAAGQESPENPESSLRERPSHGGFDNLADEFDARAQSREVAKAFNKQQESVDSGLDDKAIKEKIDPYGPDTGKTEGCKAPCQRTVEDENAEWIDGVDRLDELPTGESLLEHGSKGVHLPT